MASESAAKAPHPAQLAGVVVTLPPNVYEFDGVSVKLLAPVDVQATHEAFNDKLRMLAGDKSRQVVVRENSVATEGLRNDISEIRGQHRQLADTNNLILTRLEELSKAINRSGATPDNEKAGKPAKN